MKGTYLFNEMKQGEETMEEYVSRLRVQASRCFFASSELESHICDRAISGCRDMDLKQRLLQKSDMDLSVDNLITWSTSYEMCRAQAKEMTGQPSQPEGDINLVRHRQGPGGAAADTNHGRHRGPGGATADTEDQDHLIRPKGSTGVSQKASATAVVSLDTMVGSATSKTK